MIILGVGIGVLLVVTVGLAVARKVARDSRNFLVAERSQALPLANSPLYASGTFPVVLGGDQSIGYPTTRRRRCHLGCGNLGIIPFDRHVDTLETDFDERIYPHRGSTLRTSPTCPAKNLVQIGIGAWQAPRAGVKVDRGRGTAVTTVTGSLEMGIEAAQRAPEAAGLGPPGAGHERSFEAVDVEGQLKRPPLRPRRRVHSDHRGRPRAGRDRGRRSFPPYDNADITALLATRVICDTLGCLVCSGHLSAASRKECT